MSEFNCSRRTAFNIKKSRAELIALSDSATPLTRIRSRQPQLPEIEKPLLDYMNRSRIGGIKLTTGMMQKKALEIRDGLRDICEGERHERLGGFSASHGWIVAVAKRHGLRCAMHKAEAAKGVGEVRERIRGYAPSSVYLFDESLLHFRALPKEALGGDRITFYVCANLTGCVKMPPCVVTTEDVLDKRVDYVKGELSDGNTFRKWLKDMFIPFVLRRHAGEALLLVRQDGPHGTDVVDPGGTVCIMTVDEGGMRGVAEEVRIRYRYEMMRRIAMRWSVDFGLEEAVDLLVRAWDSVSGADMTSHFEEVAKGMADRFPNSFGKELGVRCNVMGKLCEMVEHSQKEEPLFEALNSLSREDVKQWCNVETSAQMGEVLMKEFEDRLLVRQDAVACAERGAGVLPGVLDVVQVFRGVEHLAMQAKLDGVRYFLKRAKSEFLEEINRGVMGSRKMWPEVGELR